MEVQQFEQAILKMAFETDAKITTASVAYYLGIPARKANELLEALLAEGVLELDSDGEGNLYYFIPNQGDPASLGDSSSDDDSWAKLEAAADIAANGGSDVDEQDAAEHTSPVSDELSEEFFHASIDDEEQAPFSPSQFSPHQGADGRSTGAESETSSYRYEDRYTDDDWFQSERFHSSPQSQPYGGFPHQRHTQRRSSRFDGIPDGVTSRLGRTDARAGSCGDASIVVENAASCEPRPLADARPTVTSCNDVNTSNFSTHQDYGSFGFTASHNSTALATTSNTGEMTLTADNHIEQPEHQPGMALLLSLILCGTGQIYNGEVSKGIIMLILCFLLWFVFLGWVVHIWSIVDAVVVAERINRQSSNNSPGQPQHT